MYYAQRALLFLFIYNSRKYIADSAEDVQVGCNSEFHAARQSSDN